MQKVINNIEFDLGLRAYMLFEEKTKCSWDEAIKQGQTYRSLFNLAYCSHVSACKGRDLKPMEEEKFLDTLNDNEDILMSFIDFVQEANKEKKADTKHS